VAAYFQTINELGLAVVGGTLKPEPCFGFAVVNSAAVIKNRIPTI